jgi:hypothetical protein
MFYGWFLPGNGMFPKVQNNLLCKRIWADTAVITIVVKCRCKGLAASPSSNKRQVGGEKNLNG